MAKKNCRAPEIDKIRSEMIRNMGDERRLHIYVCKYIYTGLGSGTPTSEPQERVS